LTRTFPEKIWRWIVPTYSLILAAYVTYKIVPEIIQKLSG